MIYLLIVRVGNPGKGKHCEDFVIPPKENYREFLESVCEFFQTQFSARELKASGKPELCQPFTAG